MQASAPGKSLRTAYTAAQVDKMLNSSQDTKVLMERVGYYVSCN